VTRRSRAGPGAL